MKNIKCRIFKNILVLFVLAACQTSFVFSAERQYLKGHIPNAVQRAESLGSLPENETVNVSIGLPLRNQDRLNELIREVGDPASPQYRRYLTPQRFADEFGPSQTDYEAVKQFALQNGLTISAEHSNRLLLGVEGSAKAIQDAFHVQMRQYRRPEGGTFHAPDREPSLDLDVPVQYISGLENSHVAKPMVSPIERAVHPSTGTRYFSSQGKYLYFGYDFRNAFLPCLGSDVNGAGQTIALVEFDGYYSSDVTKYAQEAGLPTPQVSNVMVDYYGGSAGNNNDEVALDIDMAIAIAPGAHVLVYEMCNGCIYSSNDVLNRIATDGVANQISCSWGGGDADANTVAIFKQYAAQGQSYFQSSGDSGAYLSDSPTPTVPNPIDISSLMTVVGGTELTTSGTGGSLGTYTSETTWRESYSSGIGASSGGICNGTYSVAIPSYQVPFITSSNKGSSTYRNIPDVSWVAFDIFIYYNGGTAAAIGGTSAATPLWAGLMALMNQQALKVGKGPVGFANPYLYSLASDSAKYSSCFHDVADGSTNNYSGSLPDYYRAVAGYDLATGLGSPACGIVDSLIDLVPTNTPTPQAGALSQPALAPVPIHLGQSFCLVTRGDYAKVRIEFFDLTGAMVLSETTDKGRGDCWPAKGIKEGLYWARIRCTDASGKETNVTQKVWVTK